MKLVTLIMALFVIPSIFAETTFFDDPDSFFIMSVAPTMVGSSSDCRYQWKCSGWGECSLKGVQERNCTNMGTCLNTYYPPVIEQNCTYAPPIKEETTLTNKSGIETEMGVLSKNALLIIAGLVIIYFILIIVWGKEDNR